MTTSLNFKFSNVFGSSYTGGSVSFSPDGTCLFSPVSNLVSVVDLTTSRTATLPSESRNNVERIAISPDSKIALFVDVDGYAKLVSLQRAVELHRINFKSKVTDAKFSPDSRFLAVACGRKIKVWLNATANTCWQFVPLKTFVGHVDTVNHLCWSSDSSRLISSGADSIVRVWSITDDNPDSVPPAIFVDQLQSVRGSFFSRDNKDIFSVSRTGFLIHWKLNNSTWEVSTRSQLETTGAVTAADFDTSSNVLVCGLSTGIFCLYELPSLAALQSFTVGGAVTSLALAKGGDWVAVGVAEVGQLLVWEWKAESFVFKQQGHHHGVNCVAYSEVNAGKVGGHSDLLDTFNSASTNGSGGVILATGGIEGKVKLWHTMSGFCFATFANHTASVEAIVFTPNGNAVISASLDGSVRAYDLLRYRNFRTLTAPDSKVQFGSVTVDSTGDIVAAGAASGNYSVYLWALRTGQLLDELSGHTSRISQVMFGGSDGLLATASWDKTLKVWNVFGREGKGGAPESLVQQSHVTCCAFDPSDNGIIAIATLMGKILFWDAKSGTEIASIDGIRDITTGRKQTDRFAPGALQGKGVKRDGSGTSPNLNQYYSTIAYTGISGGVLLACSANSAFVCVYDTSLKLLLSKIQITSSVGLNGIKPFLNSKNDVEGAFDGLKMDGYDLLDPVAKKLKRKRDAAALPGVKAGEMASISKARDFKLFSVAGARDGQQFAIGCSEGAYVFSSVASNLGGSALERFQPVFLADGVTAGQVVKLVEDSKYEKALTMALALNDYHAIRYVFERTPLDQIASIIASAVPIQLLVPLVSFLSWALHPVRGLPHLEGLLMWAETLLSNHYADIQEQVHAGPVAAELKGLLCSLIQNVAAHSGASGRLLSKNAATLEFFADVRV